MVQPLIPNNIKNSKVLVAALDWGMGHTTRCVSIVRDLLLANNQVVFAGDEKQLAFIKADFPSIRVENLTGYKIQLDPHKDTYLQLTSQALKITKAIKNEHHWLVNYVSGNAIDYVISDNRYGFYHPEIPSVIITHQLNLQVPKFRKRVNKIIQKKIEKFDTCWVPDSEKRTLTGALSSADLSIPIHFIGVLCRFAPIESEIKYDFLIILSGPEPARSQFLDYAKRKAEKMDGRIAFVGENVAGYDSFMNLTTKQLNCCIAESDTVYARAGYTTLMEMAGLNKKAYLLPTKGQYEQEYLAEHLQLECITFLSEIS